MTAEGNFVRPLADLCIARGLFKVFISPGARSAPLVRAFTEDGRFDCEMVNDERAAAFIALGFSKASGKAAILICTSGSAALHYGPAVAEADGSDVPLLLLSADRPSALLGQFEGQTTVQDHIFRPWVRHSLSLDGLSFKQHSQDSTEKMWQALSAPEGSPPGPVHINIHLEEPLFVPQTPLPLTIPQEEKSIPKASASPSIEELKRLLEAHQRVLIVPGSRLGEHTFDMPPAARVFIEAGAVLLHEPGCGWPCPPAGIPNGEDILRCLREDRWPSLAPDLLITWGGNRVGKRLKQLLQRCPPRIHIRLDPYKRLVRISGTQNEVWDVDPYDDTSWSQPVPQVPLDYLHLWQGLSQKALERRRTLLAHQPFSDLTAVTQVVQALPEEAIVHVGNSMVLRYFYDAYPLATRRFLVDVNRGVSGIDGTLGTAVGWALARPHNLVWCLLGDVAFHHGVNALWRHSQPSQLKIVVFNNGGGNIFGIVPGPETTPSPHRFFENRMTLRADYDACKFGLEYIALHHFNELPSALEWMIHTPKAAILEIFTDPDVNIRTFKQFELNMQLPL